MGLDSSSKVFSIFTALFQVLLAVLFAVCTNYQKYDENGNDPRLYYPFFQDIHVMIFVGFGFLMTFLKRYSYGAVGYNMFISALVLQWATLMGGWLETAFEGGEFEKISLDLTTMIGADFACGAVLITFGAVLGKVSRLQLTVIGILEIIFYCLNEKIIVKHLIITDAGGTILIHMFGAYFGLAVARVLYNGHTADSDKEGSVYHSDVFAMIGTIFLWMYWPSFNGGLLGPGPQQHRALINTYFSLAACCVVTFAVSPLVEKKNRIDMVHVQNATLAGGVAVGTCADLIIQPWGAIVIGMLAGLISTLGYAYVTPFLTSKLKIHDTCGVHNLHGMPAIFGAIAGVIASCLADSQTYGAELEAIWGARQSTTQQVTTTVGNTTTTSDVIVPGRSGNSQGGYQALAILVTLLIAIIGGLLTGIVVKFLDGPDSRQIYDDADYWIVDEGEEETEATGGLLMEEKTAEA